MRAEGGNHEADQGTARRAAAAAGLATLLLASGCGYELRDEGGRPATEAPRASTVLPGRARCQATTRIPSGIALPAKNGQVVDVAGDVGRWTRDSEIRFESLVRGSGLFPEPGEQEWSWPNVDGAPFERDEVRLVLERNVAAMTAPADWQEVLVAVDTPILVVGGLAALVPMAGVVVAAPVCGIILLESPTFLIYGEWKPFLIDYRLTAIDRDGVVFAAYTTRRTIAVSAQLFAASDSWRMLSEALQKADPPALDTLVGRLLADEPALRHAEMALTRP